MLARPVPIPMAPGRTGCRAGNSCARRELMPGEAAMRRAAFRWSRRAGVHTSREPGPADLASPGIGPNRVPVRETVPDNRTASQAASGWAKGRSGSQASIGTIRSPPREFSRYPRARGRGRVEISLEGRMPPGCSPWGGKCAYLCTRAAQSGDLSLRLRQ
jgi:hypothetical protein